MDIFTSPGFLVTRLAHEMNVELDRRLQTHNVTISQWKVLMFLWQQEGCSQAEIQEQLGLEGATVTGLVQRMTRAELVQRRPDPVDKRVQRVFLTERGRALEPVLGFLVEEVNVLACKDFTADEQAFFVRLLTRSLHNLTDK